MWLSSWVTDNEEQLYFPKADGSRRYTQLISFISCQSLHFFVENPKLLGPRKLSLFWYPESSLRDSQVKKTSWVRMLCT